MVLALDSHYSFQGEYAMVQSKNIITVGEIRYKVYCALFDQANKTDPNWLDRLLEDVMKVKETK